MNLPKELQHPLVIIGIIVAAIAAFAYGALTAPQSQPTKSQQVVQQSPKVSSTAPATISPTPSAAPTTKKTFEQERDTIIQALMAKYPRVATDYTVGKGKLYNDGEWYGATLTYKGTDTLNRDTLRVLAQKKDGVWTLRTTPPEPLLSKYRYSDVPIETLRDINKAISLPNTDAPTAE